MLSEISAEAYSVAIAIFDFGQFRDTYSFLGCVAIAKAYIDTRPMDGFDIDAIRDVLESVEDRSISQHRFMNSFA